MKKLKNMKQLFTLIGLCLFGITISISATGQTQDELEKMRQDFENYKKQEEENFRKYVEEQDKAFAEFLKNDWEQFELFKSRKSGRVPGPEKIPSYKPEMNVKPTAVIPIMEIREEDMPEVSKEPPVILEKKPLQVKLPVQEIKKPVLNRKTAIVNYYGKEINIFYDPKLHHNPGESNGPNLISNQFETLSKADYFPLIESLFQIQRQLNLNDWAYLLLVEDLSEQICLSKKEEVLFQWFILLKSGYKTKLAYYNDDISLMIPTENALYGLPYLRVEGTQYYVLNKDMKHIHTYNADYPGSERAFNLNLAQTPNLPMDLEYRTFNANTDSELKIAFNKNLKSFYNDFPQSEISVFFHSALNPVTKESLTEYFNPLINEKTELEAVNEILHFIQHSFDYQTDQEQFGYEKFFFPDELFMYPAADCEDRSVLFAFLVEELLGLEVIGLDYPGHIATAVHFNEKTEGRYIETNGKRYTICDPTFIGAPAGACMPQYANSHAAIIPLKTRKNLEQIAEPLWADIYEQGGYRNNVDQIAAEDINGNIYLCGSFNKTMNLSGQKIISEKARSGFVACYSPESRLQWLIKVDNTDYVSPENLIPDENDGIILTGKTHQGDETTQFISRIDASQNLQWFVKFDAEKDKKVSGYVDFYIRPDGTLKEKENMNDMSVDESSAISFLPDGTIRLNAYIPAPVFANKATTMSAIEMAKLWKNRSLQYEKNMCHPSVSGIMAFFNTLEEYMLKVNGKQISATLNAFNPNFMVENAQINENMKKISTISLDHGILSISTVNNESIRLGDIIIHDNARFRIHNYQTGNLKLTVINGVEYKSIIRKFDINYLKVFRVNGDILIDYGKKHDQRIISTKPDIVN